MSKSTPPYLEIACSRVMAAIGIQRDRIASGAHRIATRFQFPNGTHVDVFMHANPGGTVHIDDHGQTVEWLEQVGCDIPANEDHVRLGCECYGLVFDGLALYTDAEPGDVVLSATRLASACLFLVGRLMPQPPPDPTGGRDAP